MAAGLPPVTITRWKMNYRKKYTTVADLLGDDGFLAWYLKINDRYVQAWDRWMAENKEHNQLAKKAFQLLTVMMSPGPEPVPQQQLGTLFDRLYKKIMQREENTFSCN